MPALVASRSKAETASPCGRDPTHAKDAGRTQWCRADECVPDTAGRARSHGTADRMRPQVGGGPWNVTCGVRRGLCHRDDHQPGRRVRGGVPAAGPDVGVQRPQPTGHPDQPPLQRAVRAGGAHPVRTAGSDARAARPIHALGLCPRRRHRGGVAGLRGQGPERLQARRRGGALAHGRWSSCGQPTGETRSSECGPAEPASDQLWPPSSWESSGASTGSEAGRSSGRSSSARAWPSARWPRPRWRAPSLPPLLGSPPLRCSS